MFQQRNDETPTLSLSSPKATFTWLKNAICSLLIQLNFIKKAKKSQHASRSFSLLAEMFIYNYLLLVCGRYSAKMVVRCITWTEATFVVQIGCKQ